MYYLCSENKGADQLRGYREADLRLCFRICKKPVFLRRGSFHDPDSALTFLHSLEYTTKQNKTINKTEDGVDTKMIEITSDTCCDVFFLLDMSKSMDEDDFGNARSFIKALLPKIGISKDGTRIDLIFFAENVDVKINHTTEGLTNLIVVFDDYEMAEDAIDKLNRTEIMNKVGMSTDLSKALAVVKTRAETIRKHREDRKIMMRDKILILISDGDYTGGGNPKEIANELKDMLGFQIYSVAVGSKDINENTMRAIASKDDTNNAHDKHFISIKPEDLSEITDAMVRGESLKSAECGYTNPDRTDIRNESAPMDKTAQPDAWPWMVQLRTDSKGMCGGSLIARQWVLTAAHCLKQNRINKLRFNSAFYAGTDGLNVEITNDNQFVHESYNTTIPPIDNFDVALIKLPKKLTFSDSLRKVCLWDNSFEADNITNLKDKIYGAGVFGVVTGWGPRPGDERKYTENLKQLQIETRSDEECPKSGVNASRFDPDNMFCAGSPKSSSSTFYIDTCEGDSGGPFVVENPNKDNFYIQTGIVSFGYECGARERYGFYTKLNDGILEWINNTMTKNN